MRRFPFRRRRHGSSLQRRLFRAFFGGVILTGALVMVVTTMANSGFRDSMERLHQWLGVQFARVWEQPDASALQHFTDETALALGAHIEVTDTAGIRRAASAGTCHGKPIEIAIQREGARLGQAALCWDAPKGFRPGWVFSIALGVIILWTVSGRLAKRLARPLAELSEVVKRIGNGDLTARTQLSCHAPDEIGIVAHAVNDMATRLEHQATSQKALLANVSHELRTPLARIRLISEIARGNGVPKKTCDDLDLEVAELDSLVGQLLATSRLDFEQVAKRVVDLKDLATRALERASVEQSCLVLNTTQLQIEVDPTLMQRALANLFDNARKHGGGVDRFEVSDAPGQIRFSVFDTGSGFTKSTSALFEPFSSPTSASRGDGLGLGLALVKRIAAAHGGTVWAVNRTTGGAEVGFSVASTA